MDNSYPEQPYKSGSPGTVPRRILCIRCMITLGRSKNPQGDRASLIRNHALHSWLLLPPPDPHPIHSIADLRQQVPLSFWSEDAEKVLLKYNSGPDYYQNLMPLLNMEAKANSAEKLKMKQEVFLRHEWQDDGHLELMFDLSKGRASLSDIVILTRGHISLLCSITGGGAVSIVLSCDGIHPPNMNYEAVLMEQAIWTAEFRWNPTPDCRKMDALEKFAFARDSTDLRDIILGSEVPTKDSHQWTPVYPPEPFRLSDNQQKAVQFALSQRISLIHGPPGTGKTRTLIALVHSLVKAGEQVLVCAPSNTATDHLFKDLDAVLGEGVWRLRMGVITNNHGCEEPLKETGDIPPRSFRNGNTVPKNVLCCTCIGSGIKFDQVWENDRFDNVIIDEAAQASEPETLIPIVRGCKKLVLFGDECQLGPVVTDDEARQSGLAYSMFRRLLRLNFPSFLLDEQYRINSKIWEATSKPFYHGKVRSFVQDENEIAGCPEFPWPKPGHPIMFWSCHGEEKRDPSGSIRNRMEAIRVLKVVNRFLELGVEQNRIGVITFYDAQRGEINKRLRRSGLRIEAHNVDSFQGHESDFIILSCVRSNDHGDVGFLDLRRMNVALTRAKLGLVVIGNDETLGKCEFRNNGNWQQPGDKMAEYKEGNAWVELLKGLSPFTRGNDWGFS